jgi:aminoglycoside 6'-N-acetyltransferase
MILFETDKIAIHRLEKEDSLLLLKWLTNPTLLEYYEGRDKKYNLGLIYNDFFDETTNTEIKGIIYYEKNAIGYLQYYRIENSGFDEYEYIRTEEITFGIDLFIGEPEYWNIGIGTKIMKSCINYLIKILNAEIILIDPQEENIRAIHVYEKIGFRKIKLLIEHEWHEGKKRNSWLMELRNKNLTTAST